MLHLFETSSQSGRPARLTQIKACHHSLIEPDLLIVANRSLDRTREEFPI